jgi:flagellar basal-body rod modification protein FlgD
MVTAVSSANTYTALNGGTPSSAKSSANEASDRFLKLLVTQMQNQDPLNPMDNAQITSQMAQINTVNGIEQLNTTVEGLNTQFSQLQALAGASLVGREVVLAGKNLIVDGGAGKGGFDLSGAADSVKVEVLSPAGRVVKTLDLGAQSAGRQFFNWKDSQLADDTPGYTFRITATKGTAAVPTTALMRDRVDAIHTNGSSLMLETAHNGTVAYRDVKSVN